MILCIKGRFPNLTSKPIISNNRSIKTTRNAIPPKFFTSVLLTIYEAPNFSSVDFLSKAFKEIMSDRAVTVIIAVAGKLIFAF